MYHKISRLHCNTCRITMEAEIKARNALRQKKVIVIAKMPQKKIVQKILPKVNTSNKTIINRLALLKSMGK